MHYDANGSPVEGFSNLRAVFKDFKFVDTDPFPTHLCVLPDARDPNVRNSTDGDYHAIVLVNRRFPGSAEVRVMRPFLCLPTPGEEDPETTYGWEDTNGNFASHGVHPAYAPDDSKVYAWKLCAKGTDFRV
jgi:hypothetical protein